MKLAFPSRDAVAGAVVLCFTALALASLVLDALMNRNVAAIVALCGLTFREDRN